MGYVAGTTKPGRLQMGYAAADNYDSGFVSAIGIPVDNEVNEIQYISGLAKKVKEKMSGFYEEKGLPDPFKDSTYSSILNKIKPMDLLD
ncbi:MAG: hypothetical protein GXO64_00640, partial [Candidatus Micrarchaeota archaeon]|nr:hypothetical protein [Candidatus Micrarchaeota archaeon]